MSSRRTCLIIASLFVVAFALSLTLDWHGSFAVAFAIGFFLFVANSTRSESRPREIIGLLLIAFSAFSAIGNLHRNLVFLSTVAAGGAILFLNPVGRLLAPTEKSNENV
jgi:hypothetical protein